MRWVLLLSSHLLQIKNVTELVRLTARTQTHFCLNLRPVLLTPHYPTHFVSPHVQDCRQCIYTCVDMHHCLCFPFLHTP